MKKTVFIITAVVLATALLLGATACSSGSGFWKLSNVSVDNVEKIELVNSGGTIKVLEGERLATFMDDFGQLAVSRNKDGYPDNSYDYCIRIYLQYKEGYVRYYLGQELTVIDMKSGAKEGFYEFEDYDAALKLVADYFYAQ